MAEMERPSLKVVGDKPLYDEELRLWLQKHIEAHPHLNTNVLSRADKTGASRASLDGYIAGTYFLPKEKGGMGVTSSKIEDKIRAYREKVEGTVRHGYANTFVETRAWQQFQHACHTAINENVIVVVYAPPGVGKSRCLKEYSVRKMTKLPIDILCSANITTRYFVQKIAHELGLDDRIPTAKLEDLICEKLAKYPRPIFIDQANYLKESALGTVCYIWENARVPIVLLGTKDLYDLFTTTRLTQDVRMQLSSRVAMHYPLMELSEAEVKSIIKAVLGERASDSVVARIYNLTLGNHRHLDFLFPRIADFEKVYRKSIERGDLSYEELIDKAASRLMVG